MSDFNSQVQVDLRGNLTAASKNMARAVSGLASSASRSFGRLNKAAVGVSNGIDRMGNKYTGLATGFATGALARGVVNVDAQLKHIEVRMGQTAEEAAELKSKIYDVANNEAVRMDVSQLVAAMSEVLALTGDLEFASANIMNIGVAARSSGSAAGDIAKVVANLKKLDIDTPEQVAIALETLIAQGDAGAVEFKDLAAEFGGLASAMQALEQKGQGAVSFLGAFMQTTQDTTGNVAQTATAIDGFLNSLAKNGDMLAEGGIKVFDAEGNNRDLKLVLEDTIKGLNGIEDPLLRAQKQFEIFGETGSKALTKMQSDYAASGGLTMLDDLMKIQVGDGKMVQDAIDQTKTMAAAIDTLNASLSRMADNNLSEPIQELADAISGLSSEELENLFDIAATGVAAAAGIWTLNKAIRGTAAGVRLVQGLRGGTRAGGRAAGALASATATPVMVTNWPVGRGGGGYGYGKNGKSRSPRMRARGRFGGLISMGAKTSAATGLTSIGSKAGKFVRGAGPLATGLAVMNIGSAAVQGDGRGVAGATGSLGGALVGGKLGALGGSLAGPIGTAVGGVIGAGLGAYLGEEAITSLWDSLFSRENSQNSGNNEALERNNALLERQASVIEENTRVQGVMGRRQRRQQQRGDAAGALEGGQP